MSQDIYIFSGLGADERVFQKIDFSGFHITYIKWIPPLENEPVGNYANRIIGQITSPKPILIGLSFGGIMAIEVAKQIATQKIILVSSAKTFHEIPAYFRNSGKMGMIRLIPASWMKKSNFITDWFFGISSESDKLLLKQILNDTDPIFLKWAFERISHWTNNTIMENTFHIHGTSDRILPIRNIKCDCKIEGGGHFMILDKAEELSKVIQKQLE